MAIENDLTRIATALEGLLFHVSGGHQGVEPLLAPTPELDDAEATYVVSTPTPAPIPAPETPAAPTRVRRTKAQIEADKQAEAQRILAAMQAQTQTLTAPVVAPAPTPAAAAPTQTFTLADFRPRFVKLADAGKRDALIELIGTLGGKMLTDIKPDQYPALHAGLVKLEGGHV